MNDQTRAVLLAWRNEISAGIAEAAAAVEAAKGAVQRATQAEAVEKLRVDDLRAAVAVLPAEQSLATEISTRLAEAVRSAAGTPGSRGAAGTLDTAEHRLQDKREALAQLDMMLAPPSAARPLAGVIERPSAPGLAPFEPIQMPAGARPAPAQAA